jgi:hypothetical protein
MATTLFVDVKKKMSRTGEKKLCESGRKIIMIAYMVDAKIFQPAHRLRDLGARNIGVLYLCRRYM